MRRTVIAMAGALALAGCASEAELSARDSEQCRDFGFKPGTEAFANCRMQLYVARTRRPTVIERDPFPPPAPRVIVVPQKN